MDKNQTDEKLIKEIFRIAKDNKGYCKLLFYLDDGATLERVVSNNCQVNPSKQFVNNLRDLTSKTNVWIS